jgi:hypothetical protein
MPGNPLHSRLMARDRKFFEPHGALRRRVDECAAAKAA